ncbi:CFEM-domain-containing protein [Clathrospora elynae]|uniref:CFEM-domain-containing protein n=1 Tax=Clathrospora elynae TaxID=706981 RepID=A0A6A5T309_9PLEO|nr:CFEM-domain-containing protein [Clathrospora elynae]
MKSFTLASIVALASVASAQSGLDNIPSCALSCLVGPLTTDGCSALTDFACHCKKGDALIVGVQPCIKSACSEADQAATIKAVSETCAAAGVPISIPDSAPAASSAAAPTPTPTVAPTSAAASSAAVVASSVLSEASSAVASAASSIAYVASSAIESASGYASATGTGSATPTGNSTVSVSAKPSQFTGGAAQATQAVGILGAAALAMFVL